MGPSNTQTHLGAFLARSYHELKLVHERVGKSVWSGKQEQGRLAIHCLPQWALKDEAFNQVEARFAKLQETKLTSIPKPIELLVRAEHTLLVEEWVDGLSWSEAVLSREAALESAVEVFDLLADLHENEILHGHLKPSSLVFDPNSGRLKLLGLLSAITPQDFDAEAELGQALTLVQEFLSEEEYESLAPLKSGREIARRLGRLLSKVKPERSEPEFIGRDRFLSTLNDALQKGGLLTVEAPAGGGKTRLLREWSKDMDARVLWGKAAREVAPSPFQLFQNPFTQIEQELKENPALLKALQNDSDIKLPLSESFSSENRLQRSAMIWLSKLLQRLSSDRKTILVLEDVHWADDFSQNFIEHWNAGQGPALLVVSFRANEVKADHPLLKLDCPRIQLPQLNEGQAARLLRSVQPSASQTLVESAIQRAQGNPFLLLQFLRSGTVKGDFHQVRVSSLDESTQRSLATGAILGDEFESDLVEYCMACKPSLSEAVKQGMLTATRRQYRFTHDRLRESCLALLNSSEIAQVHLKAAEFLSEQPVIDQFKVAFHFHLAGRPELGHRYAIQAAEAAEKKHDLSTAVYYYQAALAGLTEQQSEAVRLFYRLGDCYRLIGRYLESEECFQSALSRSSDPLKKARIMSALGDVYFKQANLEKARKAIVEGLTLLGEQQPKWVLGSFAYRATILAWRHFFPKAGKVDKTNEALLKVNLYNRLAYVGWFLEGPIPSIRAHLCELNLVEQYGDSRELARAQATHAIAMSALPWWKRSLEYGSKGINTARKVGDKWSEGQAGHFYGAALLGASRLKEARTVLLEARKLLEETGDRWEENGACYHLALTYYRLGVLDKAVELAAKTQKVGVEINDRLAAGDNLYTWARASEGRLPRHVIEMEKSFSSPDLQRACEILAAEAIVNIRERRYEDAIKLLRSAWNKYREKRVQSLYSASIPAWLTTAERLWAQSSNGSTRKKRLEQARRTLKLALAQAKLYRTNLPHAQREQALILLLEGDYEKARAVLLKSVSEAKQRSLGHEAKISASLFRHFDWLLGEDERVGEWASVDCAWLLGDESEQADHTEVLEHLLEGATRISQCLSVPTALHQLCQGCKLVLGTNVTCALVYAGSDGNWEQISGDFGISLPQEPLSTDGWHPYHLPGLEKPTYLLLKVPNSQIASRDEALIDFLITVTTAVVDRAGRTVSSTVLSHNLQHSTALLNQEASRLFKAREQLLLSERLALTGRLAAGLVHDLRNLILSINGSSELVLLDLENDDAKRREVLEILEAGRKSDQLLTHLSGLTRGDIMGPQRLTLGQRISETKPLLRSLCGPIVELDFFLDDCPPVLIDPIVLDRILLNLVMNARDAIKPGGIIEVSTSHVKLSRLRKTFPNEIPAGNYSLVEVSDDGSGIPKDVLPRIFELHFTTKGKFGTGVGLASVLEMIRDAGAYLTVDTSPQGTSFKIYFPGFDTD